MTVPKRRRRYVTWFGRMAGVLVLLCVAVVLRYAFAKPGWTPARGQEYAAKFGGPIEPRLDARPIVAEVGEKLNALYFEVVTEPGDQQTVAVDFIYDPNHEDPLGETERLRGLAREFLDRVRGSGLLTQIDQIAEADAYRRPAEPKPIHEWIYPDLGRARHIARINRARMFDAAWAGDWDEYVRAYESSLALSRLLFLRGSSIEARVGAAVLEHVDEELRLTLMERDVPEDALADLQRRREHQQAGLFEAGPAMEGERMQLLDLLDATHTRGGTLLLSEFMALSGERDFLGIPAEHVHWFNFVGMFFASKTECVALADQLLAPSVTIDEPPQQRRNERMSLQDVVELVPRRMPVLAVGIPDIGEYVMAMDGVRTYTAATDLMLALARHRHDASEYPESLLTFGPIATDPMTGSPFGYRRFAPESDPSGRPYLLYSFGRDRRDDGGKGPKTRNGDRQLFKDQFKPGEDAIINRPRTDR